MVVLWRIYPLDGCIVEIFEEGGDRGRDSSPENSSDGRRIGFEGVVGFESVHTAMIDSLFLANEIGILLPGPHFQSASYSSPITPKSPISASPLA